MAMAQHFLLSAEARTLSLASIYKGGEDAAYGILCRMRWAETDGAPVCPRWVLIQTAPFLCRMRRKL